MSNVLRTIWAGSRQSVRNALIQKRNISRTVPRNEKPTTSVVAEQSSNVNPSVMDPKHMGLTHKVKPYQKYALVWAGKYKSMAEIPERVSHGVLDSALNVARIKISIYMMLATAVVAGLAVYSGKQAAERGESLAKYGIEQQKQLREQGLKEAAEGKAPAEAPASSH